MIVWHFLYDLSAAGLLPPSLPQNGVMELFRLLIAGSFVSISGVCAALLVSAVTDLFGTPVRWGILHLLGTCMMLYAAVGKRWAALPAAAACGAALLVFALTFPLPLYVRVDAPFLFPFGLRTAAFSSADYYPLLPWAGLFFAAAAAAKRLEELPPEEKFTPAPRFFAWLSRRSLAVYLLHQPVLLAVTALLESATRGT